MARSRSHANRGVPFERLIERTNATYKNKGRANIQKIPTPWKVQRNPKTGKIIKAFPEKKSTVDFIGMAHGRGIAFEAKSTRERTRFPLKNIEPHQINFLKMWKDQGGVSFLLVEFEKHQEVYFLPFDDCLEWWNQMKDGGRKSIPYDWFVFNCDLVKSRNGVLLDYLKHCR